MKVKELIAELEVRNPEARVYILDGEGNRVEVRKLFRIESSKPKHEQDVLLMEKF